VNLASLAKENIEKYGEYDALTFNEKVFTNVRQSNMAKSFANGLAGLGVKHGDRVGMVMANCSGAWAMPVVFVLTAEQMTYIFRDSEARVVVTHSIFLDKILEAQKQTPTLEHIILADENPPEGYLSVGELISQNPPDFETVDCDPDDIAVLMYTSGTTGRPKGVMLSHNNLYTNAIMVTRREEMEPMEVGLGVLPLNHSYGVITTLAGQILGSKGVMIPWFNAEETLKLIEKHKVINIAMVPTMYIQILNLPNHKDYDTSSMKRWACAAAPLPMEARERFEKTFNCAIHEGYGLTEASPAVATSPTSMPYRQGSVGLPLDGCEVTIRDEDGNILPQGDVGEICVKGSNVMKGYYKMPEETAETLKGGWLHTGDAGYLDKDGYLYLTERIKDLIIRGGENIFPKDIEDVLHRHSKIAEVAVVAKRDPVYGEDVLAVVVPAPGAELTEEEVLEFGEENLPKFQKPKAVVVTDSLPKNPLGKVLKRELREKYGQ